MHTIIAGIPIFCFVALFLNYKARSTWRESFLLASISWGLCVVVFTEALSLFRAIKFWTIVILWILVSALAIFFLIRNRVRLRSNLQVPNLAFSPVEWILLVLTFLVVLTTFVIAWIAPPNSWDSMTYHMGRIVHWMQNGSVEFYPTHILRQLHLSPGAEYIMLHFQILKGNDGFANLVQWFSMLGSLIGVSLLAEILGADRRGQVFSAAIAASIPMGIFQATSTQNDYVAAFWLVCFIYFAFRLVDESNWINACLAGASLGLAILTKATVYLYAFPFLIFVSWSVTKRLLKQNQIRQALNLLALIAMIVLAINVGQYSRNYRLYANPLGPQTEDAPGTKYANDIFTAPALASNLLRNVSMHLGTHYYNINREMEKYVYAIHDWLGISPNDPRTTWAGTEFHINYPSFYDGKVYNFFHAWLILLTIPIIILRYSNKSQVGSYFISLILAFTLFSFYLRWQAWHSRLQLPLFVLWAPLLGCILTQIRVNWLADLIVLGLVVSAYTPLTHNLSRPLLGRKNIFNTDRAGLIFEANPSIYKPYIETQNYFDHHACFNIGLITDADGWEYPLWVLLSHNGKQEIRIEHILVDNISAATADLPQYQEFDPCAIIVTDRTENPINFHGHPYYVVQNEKNILIYAGH